jgi:Domain of unknown function (DU1801)
MVEKLRIQTAIKNPDVAKVFEQYPEDIRNKLLLLRNLVLETAAEIPDLGKLEETLKWGEPSYLVVSGSTIRMNWQIKDPDHYKLYFNCKTILIETFIALYGNLFNYEGNRAIVFTREESLPIKPLKHCIGLSLQYHRFKHLPLLGA